MKLQGTGLRKVVFPRGQACPGCIPHLMDVGTVPGTWSFSPEIGGNLRASLDDPDLQGGGVTQN
jgi:hypothetical protein